MQSIKDELLAHFIVFGEEHLRLLVTVYLMHYHLERPHQGIDNVPPVANASEPVVQGRIACRERLGGLLKHYERKAASTILPISRP